LTGSFRQRHVGALLRLRPPAGQHTAAEADALARYAKGCRSAVEIGVAEGVSAAVIRSAMDPAGRLWLVDPYFSKYPVSAAHLVARRTVGASAGAAVEWVRSLSHDAAATWDQPVDFVFVDGDHSK
jgi:predicted O-methyltransferase YrrM